MKRSEFCFLLVAALAIAPTANGNSRVGTVAGTVLNAQGNPVANATVTIQTSDGRHPHATHTNAHGHFAFVRFESGQYDLRAYSNTASSEWLKRALIRSGKTTQITLRLTK